MNGTQRVNFTAAVRQDVARKAMYICSNPDCLRVTGFKTSKGKPRAIAQAAHVISAADNGPRWDEVVSLPDGTRLERGDEANALWLCMPCHYRVDSDWEAFPAKVLLDWKQDHEKRVTDLVGLDLEQSLLRLGEVRVHHDLAREMLLWLDSHRFMYFEDAREQPDYVWRAIDALRVKLVDQRSRVVDSESMFGLALAGIDNAVQDFVAALNDVRVNEIKVTSGEADFELFSKALANLRSRIISEVAPIAERERYTFQNIPPHLAKGCGDEVEFRRGLSSGGKK